METYETRNTPQHLRLTAMDLPGIYASDGGLAVVEREETTNGNDEETKGGQGVGDEENSETEETEDEVEEHDGDVFTSKEDDFAHGEDDDE